MRGASAGMPRTRFSSNRAASTRPVLQQALGLEAPEFHLRPVAIERGRAPIDARAQEIALPGCRVDELVEDVEVAQGGRRTSP